MQNAAGTIVALWRYPVKSMMGEELDYAEIGSRGVSGDRAYALIDAEDGKVASAKNPQKWGKLFDFRAAFVEPPQGEGPTPAVRITFPDGTERTSDEPGIESQLSAALGRGAVFTSSAPEEPVLEEYWPEIEGLANQDTITDEGIAVAAPGTFFDAAPIHILTTATLARLSEAHPEGRFEARRFRPNIVVETSSDTVDFVENAWVGKTLSAGDEVLLQVVIPCPRCVMTTLAQGDLPNDPGILRAVALHNRVHIPVLEQAMPSVGVYAVVIRGGLVRRGDEVKVE